MVVATIATMKPYALKILMKYRSLAKPPITRSTVTMMVLVVSTSSLELVPGQGTTAACKRLCSPMEDPSGARVLTAAEAACQNSH
jgi:hypothetical protein